MPGGWRRLAKGLGARLRGFGGLLREAAREWQRDDARILAAALAYYTLFAIAPLLLIGLAAVGMVFGTRAAQEEVIGTVRGLLSEDGVEALRTTFGRLTERGSGVLASLAGFLIVVFGASRVFSQLKAALDRILPGSGRSGLRQAVRSRLLGFAMVLAVGLLLLLSVIASTALSAVTTLLGDRLVGRVFIWHLGDAVVSLAFAFLAFAAVYKVLPAIRLPWRDLWAGAAVAAVLFTLVKYLIAFYLGQFGTTSIYGAVGAFVVVTLWAFVSAQILFFGAEVTKVRAQRAGRLPGGGRGEPGVTQEELAPVVGGRAGS